MRILEVGRRRFGYPLNWKTIAVSTVLLLLILPSLLLSPPSAQTSSTPAGTEDSLTIDLDTVLTVPEAVRRPIEDALQHERSLLPKTRRFTASAFRVSESGDWIYAVLVATEMIETGWSIDLEPDNVLEVLGKRSPTGDYVASLQGSDLYTQLSMEVPRDFIDFNGIRIASQTAINTSLLFPWTSNQQWYKLRDPGWHSGYGSYAIDFQPVVRMNPSTDYVVLAAEAGSLWEDCNDGYQSLLRINHADGQTKYLHLDVNSVPRNLLGQSIPRGQFLGLLYDGNAKTAGNCYGWSGCKFHTPCGYGTATHLHFVVSDPNVVIDGHTASNVAYSAHATRYTSSNTRSDGSGQPQNCADGEGAVLYEHSGHQGRCTRFASDDGHVGDNAIGNDAASSLRVIGNFEAVVFEHDEYNGANSTFSGDDSDLGNDVIGNDRASSVRVRRRDAGGNSNCDGGEGVYLYEHSNYGGRCSKFTGDAPNPRNWYVGNDSASSIRFVGNYEATLFEHDEYNGANSPFNSDDSDLGNDVIGNDRASSIRVRRRDAGGNSNCDGGEGVYLYEHSNYGGRCSKFTGDASNPRNWYIGNDSASSIRFIGNYEASLFEHDEYSGANSTFSGDDPDLGNDAIGNDRASSIRVQQRTSGPTACDDGQFLVEYFGNRDLAGNPAFRRCEGSISADWADGGPGNGIGSDNFSVRWSGGFWFNGDGLYRFITRTDDGVRFWLDNQLAIDHWHDMGVTEFTSDRNLDSGMHTLRMEYYEHGGQAIAHLSWQFLQGTDDPDDGRTIGYDAGIDGGINPAQDRDDYYFDGSSGQAITIRMDKRDSDLDTYVELYNPDGSLLGQDDDGGDGFNSRLAITLRQNGRHKVIARAYGSSMGGYRLNLSRESTSDADDNQWISFGGSIQGTVSPNDDRDWYYFSSTSGRVVSIRMNKIGASLDGYLELYDEAGTKIGENDDGGGDRNAWLVCSLPGSGVYRIMARSWNLGSSGRYDLSLNLADNTNLARGKGAYATSTEFNGVEPYKAFDGNLTTRWSSEFSDSQFIYADLDTNTTFDQVVLRWETAYARRYGLYYWTGSAWDNIYWTDNGDGGNDTIAFAPVQARYVGMYGVARGTQWGYSLWEFEVYNLANTVIPLVPPDPGDKPPESGVDPMVPLPPNDPGKLTLLIGEGSTGQENTPLPGTPGEGPEGGVQETVPNAYILYPQSDFRADSKDIVFFQGLASDNDEEGQSIVAYRWNSSIDGSLSTTDLFTLTASSLTTGTHTIYFSAQDDEGQWSEETSIAFTVGLRSIYLPLVVKSP